MNEKPKPWSVKGISPESRRLARQAAQEAGLPIGRWLDTIIQQQAGAPIEIDRGASKRNSPDESRIEDLVANLSGKIDDMTMRLALVQTGRGLPAEDIARLDRLRIGGTFEYDGDAAEPTPVVATHAPSEQPPRARHGMRYAIFCTFLLMGLASSYIALSGALIVPPPGLTNAITQVTATVGPALRDLGFSGSAPVQTSVTESYLTKSPMSQVSLRDSRPDRSLESRAQDGSAIAQYELARAPWRPAKIAHRVTKKRVHWLKLAANQGHTSSHL